MGVVNGNCRCLFGSIESVFYISCGQPNLAIQIGNNMNIVIDYQGYVITKVLIKE